MKHKAGDKISGSHTTLIDAVFPIVNFLERLPEVSKISLGFIRMGLKSGKFRIKINDAKTCLKIKVRGSTSIQEIFVYSDDFEKTKKDLENFCNK